MKNTICCSWTDQNSMRWIRNIRLGGLTISTIRFQLRYFLVLFGEHSDSVCQRNHNQLLNRKPSVLANLQSTKIIVWLIIEVLDRCSAKARIWFFRNLSQQNWDLSHQTLLRLVLGWLVFKKTLKVVFWRLETLGSGGLNTYHEHQYLSIFQDRKTGFSLPRVRQKTSKKYFCREKMYHDLRFQGK